MNIIHRIIFFRRHVVRLLLGNRVPQKWQSLVSSILDIDKNYYAYRHLEYERSLYLRNGTVLELDDYGAGSYKKSSSRTIADIAKTSSSTDKKCRILFNSVLAFKPKKIIELGTNLGLASAYMASALSGSHLTTIEGDGNLATWSSALFDKLQLDNVKPVHNTFDTFLLSDNDSYDMIFIDGNHRYEATRKYYDYLRAPHLTRQIIIIDDIHWSKGMNRAWKEIINSVSNALIIDTFQMGIVIFDKQINGKHISYKF